MQNNWRKTALRVLPSFPLFPPLIDFKASESEVRLNNTISEREEEGRRGPQRRIQNFKRGFSSFLFSKGIFLLGRIFSAVKKIILGAI